jgi:hypothetical protein
MYKGTVIIKSKLEQWLFQNHRNFEEKLFLNNQTRWSSNDFWFEALDKGYIYKAAINYRSL